MAITFAAQPGNASIGAFELGALGGGFTWPYSGSTTCSFTAPNPTPQVTISGSTTLLFATAPPGFSIAGSTTVAFTGALKNYFNIAGTTTVSFTGYSGGRLLCAGMTTVIFYSAAGQGGACVVGDGKVVIPTTGGIKNATH